MSDTFARARAEPSGARVSVVRAPAARDGAPRPIFTVPDDHDRAHPAIADALASGRARSDDALSASRALALAFAAGGGARYLDAWIATVTAPLAAEPDHRPAVLAARIENILRSWRTLAETPAFPGLTPDVAALIEGGIGRHAGALAARVPSGGASHAEATHALLVAGLAFDGAEGLRRARDHRARPRPRGRRLARRRTPDGHARRAPPRDAALPGGGRERAPVRAPPAGGLPRPRRRGLRLRAPHDRGGRRDPGG